MSIRPDQHDLEQFEPDESPIAEYLSEIVRIPGYWGADEDCLDLKPTGFCGNGHVQLGAREPCGTRTCSEHWYQWRRRAAAALVARLAAYRYAQGGPHDRARRMLHLVTSPDQEQRWTTERFWSARSASKEPARDAGARGAAVIPHVYGVSDRGNEAFSLVTEKGHADRETGKWRVLRELTDGWDSLKPMIEVHPHTHQIAAVEDLDGEAVAEIEAETGWAVNNVRALAPFYIDADEVPVTECLGDGGKIERTKQEVVREGYEDMAHLAMYLLSHASVQPETGDLPRRNTVTYWGEVHPGAFDPEEAEALNREEWKEIQDRAAAAVGAEVPDEEEAGTTGHECARDGCEAVVHGLEELTDYMARPEWVAGLESEQAYEMVGLKVYLADRPPPGAPGERAPPGGFDRAASMAAPDLRAESEFLEWLRRLGRSRSDQYPFYRVEA